MVIASDEWLLEDAEFGVYWKLILRLNQAGGELPYDIPFLQKKLLVKRKNLQTLIEKLSKKPDFLRISGGKISLRKVEEVLAEQTEKHQKRVAAGQLGGLAKAAKSSNATVLLPSLPEQLELEQELELKSNPPLSPTGEPKEPKASKFIPPTLDEVKDYATSANLNKGECEKYVDFYASKNWMVGKNKMKDWQAAFRNWCRNAGNFAGGNSQTIPQQTSRVPRQAPRLQ